MTLKAPQIANGASLKKPVGDDDPELDGSDWTVAQQAAQYLRYVVKVKYIYMGGALQLPIAPVDTSSTNGAPSNASTAAVIIQVSQPYGMKIVRFDLIRVGQDCVAPDSTPANSNEVLKVAVVTPQAPTLMPDGQNYLYRLKGYYKYVLYQPAFTQSNLSEGSTQVSIATADDNQLTSDNFAKGMI